jgi:hypothetical protein
MDTFRILAPSVYAYARWTTICIGAAEYPLLTESKIALVALGAILIIVAFRRWQINTATVYACLIGRAVVVSLATTRILTDVVYTNHTPPAVVIGAAVKGWYTPRFVALPVCTTVSIRIADYRLAHPVITPLVKWAVIICHALRNGLTDSISAPCASRTVIV